MSESTMPQHQSSWLSPLSGHGDHSKGATTNLDMFDPFDKMETLTPNIDWIHKPTLEALHPKVQQKWRITVDCPGFVPTKKAIKTEVKDNRWLVVSGKEEEHVSADDYSVRDFRKTYELPAGAKCDQLISFMPMAGKLVVEVPLAERESHRDADLVPRVIDSDTSVTGKAVELRFAVPAGIPASQVHVSLKDRDLVVRAEVTQHPTKDRTHTVHYYKRTTLPDNTDWQHLKVTMDKEHTLHCLAPIRAGQALHYDVPIHYSIPIQNI